MRKITFLWLLVLFGITTMNANNSALSSDNSTCDCEDFANPTFTWSLDPETCTATFTADPIDNCSGELEYGWAINGAPSVSSGNNPVFEIENVPYLQQVVLKVNRISSISVSEACQGSTTVDINDAVCFNPDDITVTKQAYRNGSEIEINSEYTGRVFEWRVTIENSSASSVLFGYIDHFYKMFDPMGVEVTPLPADCIFTVEWGASSVEVNGSVDTSIPLTVNTFSTFILQPGTTVLRYKVRTCNNGAYRGYDFENCFEWSLPGPFPGSTTTCDTIKLVYGCPIGMTDGFCLDPYEIEQGDVLESHMTGHTTFLNVSRMEGDLIYNGSWVSTPELDLDPLLDDNYFEITTTPIGPNAYHFIIFSDTGTFNIGGAGVGGTWNPFKVEATLLDDLNDCIEFAVANFEMTSSGITQPVYIDPGAFCGETGTLPAGGGNEPAWITAPVGTECVGTTPVTLTASGPFQTQHPDVTYMWSTGHTTQTIDVTVGGTYSVDIIDSTGCFREAEITIDSCPAACQCGDLNPQIQLAIVNTCSVEVDVNTANCSNLTDVTYQWTFSNGNTFTGENPPIQSQAFDNNFWAKLKVNYTLDGTNYCLEEVKNEIFIPCRGKGKSRSSFEVFPNPAKDLVSIQVEGDTKTADFQLLNMQGQVLDTTTYDQARRNTNLSFDVSKVKPGIYFVRFNDNAGNVVVKRLVIQ